jgi:hypothetical protein
VAELVEAIGAALPADREVALIIIDTLSRTLAVKGSCVRHHPAQVRIRRRAR